MDGEMPERNREERKDREEREESKKNDAEVLDDRKRETDFGGKSLDNNDKTSAFPEISDLPDVGNLSNISDTSDPYSAVVGEFILDEYGIGIRWDSDEAIGLLNRISRNNSTGNILFKEKNIAGRLSDKPKVVLNYSRKSGKFKYSVYNKNAVRQFSNIVKKLLKETKDFNKTVEEIPVVEIPVSKEYKTFSHNEKREYQGAMRPGPNILPESRRLALPEQEKYFRQRSQDEMSEASRTKVG